jgi:hypothetical protein
MTEYYHTRAAEPETIKAAFAKTVLEIFAGKEVIEGRLSKESMAIKNNYECTFLLN